MRFSLPPWLKRATASPAGHEAGQEVALVVRQPPPVAIDLTDAEVPDGWSREELKAYQAEADKRASEIIATSMANKRRPRRSRWANNQYSPLMWRG